VHQFLRAGERPVADLLLFVANLDAARIEPLFSHRHPPGRPDLNRCFREPFDGLDGAGQATAISAATGGVYLNAPSVGAISDTILAGLGNLPVTVTHSVTCDPGLTVDITPASQTVTSGDSTTWSETITVDPGHPGGVTLECTVEWLLDGTLAGPEFVQHIAIEVPGADLVIVKTGPALVTEGDEYAYDLTVTNNGPANATDVVIVDPLPGSATFVSADPGCTESSGTVTCAIGALAAGASATRSITVVAGSAGSDLTNTATVSAFQFDPDPTTNTSTVVTVLNHNPTCAEVTAGDDLWPPNHKFVLRTLTGAFDIDEPNPLMRHAVQAFERIDVKSRDGAPIARDATNLLAHEGVLME